MVPWNIINSGLQYAAAIVIQGVQNYTTIIDRVRTNTPLSLYSTDVDFDLNGANCSLSGCYPHDVDPTTYKIPDVSCVIGKDMSHGII